MRAFTLVELIVTLAVIGVSVTVVGLSVATLDAPPEAAVIGALRAARDSAIRSGGPVLVTVEGSVVRFTPDGAASGGPLRSDSLVARVDPLSGQVRLALH